jgi:hypothetical protein
MEAVSSILNLKTRHAVVTRDRPIVNVADLESCVARQLEIIYISNLLRRQRLLYACFHLNSV